MWCDNLELRTLNYPQLVYRVVVHLNNVEIWVLLSESSCHAPSVRGAIVLLIYVVLDCDQLVAWSVVSGGM